MTDLSGHELTTTRDCKVPGCTNEAPARGPYAGLCSEHRTKRAAAPKAANGTGLVGQLDSLKALAKKADKLEAKAVKLKADAERAAMEAGEARDQLAEGMREIARSGV